MLQSLALIAFCVALAGPRIPGSDGAQLRRPAGGKAQELLYGAYLQLRDIGHLHTLVAGNFQASFGQGLVLAPVFHTGKSMYVASAGQSREGLRYYGSVDGEGLHGAGATLRWEWSKKTRLDVSTLYSMKRANDSTWHHLVGANLTVRHNRLQVQLTAIENIWTDSIHPYRDAAYNQHYFRGRNQAVIGASARYNHGWFDLFGEVAAAQNQHWGFVGIDITRVKNWRFIAYGDVFYFSGPKYGLPEGKTLGYDAMAEAQWHANFKFHIYDFKLRLRARQKGESTYSARAQFDWSSGGWSLRTTADANLSGQPSAISHQPYGVSIAQDVSYSLPLKEGQGLGFHVRIQGFDAREWANRIYLYEHDVLYAFSIPATYGLGGRAYLGLRWQIIKQLAIYFRISETVYSRNWAAEHDRPMNRTDIHLLLRAKL